jgi:hypothetical protein
MTCVVLLGVEVDQPCHKPSSIKETAELSNRTAKSTDRIRGQPIQIRGAEKHEETRELAKKKTG